jgi:DNA-binding transcriptional regulator GbsR (MarR family)
LDQQSCSWAVLENDGEPRPYEARTHVCVLWIPVWPAWDFSCASFGVNVLYVSYIRDMPNMSNKHLTGTARRFIEDVARLLVPWGVPQTAARLYGYLLLSAEPVSLDRITSDLEISKSSASVAARLLEQYTLARRHGERGSKRALYGVSDNYEGMLTEQNRLLAALAALLRTGATTAASETTRDRLGEMAEFYLAIRHAMESALQHWRIKGAPRSDRQARDGE